MPSSNVMLSSTPASILEVLGALVEVWRDLQDQHRDVPAVILAVGPTRSHRTQTTLLGCAREFSWAPGLKPRTSELHAVTEARARALERGDIAEAVTLQAEAVFREAYAIRNDLAQARPEVFITDDALDAGAERVLEVLVHEAVHTAATRRGIKDTGPQGRYHNRCFKQLAAEFGLVAAIRDQSRGWSDHTLGTRLRQRHADQMQRLVDAIRDDTDARRNVPPVRWEVGLGCECGEQHRPARAGLQPRGVVCTECLGGGVAPTSAPRPTSGPG